MFELTTEETRPDRFARHQILHHGQSMRFESVCDAWQHDASFRNFHQQVLADCPFEGYRWETPPLTNQTAKSIYEFVLVNAPRFCQRRTDQRTFAKQFGDAGNETVIVFPNLSGDATMIVPTPETSIEAYGHLAAFIRSAPNEQVDRFWQIVGQTVSEKISTTPIWLNTAGGGVAWLHLRLDSRPKYYHYAPYKKRGHSYGDLYILQTPCPFELGQRSFVDLNTAGHFPACFDSP